MKRALLATLALVGGCATRTPVVRPSAVAAAPQPAQGVLDPLLAADPPGTVERLRGNGYEPSTERRTGFLPPSGHSALAVTIPARRCVAFAGRASAGVHDLDGALYLPDGTLLAEDEGADAEPLVNYCADEAIPTAYLVLRAYRGAGAYAVSEWSRPVRFGDPVLSPDESRDGVLRELTVALVRRGFHADGPVREVRPEGEAALIVPLSVQPFSCYTVMASSGEGPVSLRLLDASSKEVAHGAADMRVAALQRCVGEGAADWAIELRGAAAASGSASGALSASKPVRIWVYSARERDVGGERALWLGEPGPSPAAYAEAGAPAPDGKRITHALAQGEVAELPLGKASGCQALHVTLVPGLARVSVRVEGRSGVRLAETDVGPAGGTLGYCASEPAVAVVTGRTGFGTVVLDVARSAH